MKKINIFGFKISIDLKKTEASEIDNYSESDFIKEKILYLILLMFIIIISSKLPMIFRNNNYVIGDVVKSDIYAPKTIIFRDKDAKDKIIEEMIHTLDREYIYSVDASEIYLRELDAFYKELSAIRNGNLKTYDYSAFQKKTGKEMSEKLVNKLLKIETDEELENIFETSKNLLSTLYSAGVYKERNFIRINEPHKTALDELKSPIKDIIDIFLVPNYIYDENKTRHNIEEKVSQIKEQYVEIKAGTLIARTGEILTKRKINILDRFGIFTYKTSIFNLVLITIYLIVLSTIFYIVSAHFYTTEILRKNRYKALMLLISLIFLAVRLTPSNLIYLLPIDTVLFLMFFIISRRFSVFVYMLILALMLPMIDFDLKFFMIQTVSVMMVGYLIKKINTRSIIIAVGIQLAVLKLVLYFILSYFSKEETLSVAVNSMQIFISGLFSGMFTIALLPYFEKTFNILTIFRLIELGDLSHPLLRKLSLDAPGTFQHSMMVAVLSENAVVQIGGDPVFTRVACYYHDIGKSKRPQFFVENQVNGENPHNGISPFMSKIVILSHTKDGAEMAKKYQIPKEIRDIMYEHHGTTLLAYFYNKVKNEHPEVTEEEFRYSGPKPQSKESAVIMMADSIEAAVRSLDMKNPVTIEQMIRKIVNAKIEDNQLSDSNITFKEVEIIIKSFVKTFSAIYHERIKYPGQKN
ncbi:MAG: HDIG domain-containing protein [Fusobacterium sp.]|uniref:HD family phosphohydrolase n=1 Tax=Fusobacterium sp. TaxID=68766 RepID=UPI0026DCE185|nr:HDIG domain-containing metalloprotein [Fusobacterium sp.]MDO4691096.1 HDIG domain-containing protein [Fusobacterium sp.]